MPEDLVARIALDALSARVPAAHTPVQVKHVQSVVGNALNEEPELFLTLAQLQLGFAPFGQVPRDLRVAHEIAFRVADRIDDHVRPKASAILPHPPALLLEPALLPRCPQRGFGEIDGPILFGVEAGEVLSNDLAFPIRRGATVR